MMGDSERVGLPQLVPLYCAINDETAIQTGLPRPQTFIRHVPLVNHQSPHSAYPASAPISKKEGRNDDPSARPPLPGGWPAPDLDERPNGLGRDINRGFFRWSCLLILLAEVQCFDRWHLN